MEWVADPTVWAGLATLIALEIVLGIDNLIFIAILADRLPPGQRDRGRVIGLALALGMRLALLASISWAMSLTAPALVAFGAAFSWRDLILIGGGLFLLVKATTEIHDRLEVHQALPGTKAAYAGFWPVVAQIVALDAVFSLDSVITAVGLVDRLPVMMAAVVIAVGVMLFASKPLTAFISGRPSLVILFLGFLLMVGLVLVIDGFGVHVHKGYLYAAIAFSLLVETLNQVALAKRRKFAAALPPRQRIAHAVLRLLGGVPAPAYAGGLPAEEPPAPSAFEPAERRMMRGVLDYSRRPVASIMTPRTQVEWLDALAAPEAIVKKARRSSYREFPVGRGSLDELLGLARKEDLLALRLDDAFDIVRAVHEPLVIPAQANVLEALEHFRRTPAASAILVDEYGAFQGLVTRTDLLEAIVGDLPERAGEEPDFRALPDGAVSIDGALALVDLQERLGIAELPEGEYHTAAGMVLALLGRVPSRGDRAEWGGWSFEVTRMDGLRISRIAARLVAAAQ
ncbi:MAG TPA: TerC family protein [Burkholderiales bacterium]